MANNVSDKIKNIWLLIIFKILCIEDVRRSPTLISFDLKYFYFCKLLSEYKVTNAKCQIIPSKIPKFRCCKKISQYKYIGFIKKYIDIFIYYQ